MRGNESILERLRTLSDGERAALRKCAGQPLSAVNARALQALFRAMPADVAPSEQGKWFTALSIACLWNVEEANVKASLPRMLRAYALTTGSGGVDSRLRAVLDARWDEGGYLAGKIARLARMLRANDRQAMPDMDALLDDLKKWNYDSRGVQLRWANEYYLSQKENAPDEDQDTYAGN